MMKENERSFKNSFSSFNFFFFFLPFHQNLSDSLVFFRCRLSPTKEAVTCERPSQASFFWQPACHSLLGVATRPLFNFADT